MNLLLFRVGYPQAIIPASRRSEYIDALINAQSDRGESSPLLRIAAEEARASMVETLDVCLSSKSASSTLPLYERSHLRRMLSS